MAYDSGQRRHTHSTGSTGCMTTSLSVPGAGLGQAVGSGKLAASSEGALLVWGALPLSTGTAAASKDSAPGLGAADPGEVTRMPLAPRL